MGVSGSGKSTIGNLLAESLNYSFLDADDLHPESNKKLMAAGLPLTDTERLPWLEIIGLELEKFLLLNSPLIVACSALKRSYRDLLRAHSPNLFFLYLDGTITEIHQRISIRSHEFMPSSLLDSQFANLEPLQPDEHGLRVETVATPAEICQKIIVELSKFD